MCLARLLFFFFVFFILVWEPRLHNILPTSQSLSNYVQIQTCLNLSHPCSNSWKHLMTLEFKPCKHLNVFVGLYLHVYILWFTTLHTRECRNYYWFEFAKTEFLLKLTAVHCVFKLACIVFLKVFCTFVNPCFFFGITSAHLRPARLLSKTFCPLESITSNPLGLNKCT